MSPARAAEPPSADGKPHVYRIGVISDTHGYLSPVVFDAFAGVDLILHAGDIGNDALLAELGAIAPTQAVSGNVDGPPTVERPLARQLSTFVGRIAVTHGHLEDASAFRPESMIAYFADFKPQIVLYGHTHLPTAIEIKDTTLFNPGAAGRAAVGGRPPTVGLITLDDGQVHPRLEHVTLG